MPRHLRPTPPPATPTAGRSDPGPSDAVLPTHLVATPTARGWRRLGVGTTPFNIAAFLTLALMSTFVVTGPSSRSVADAAEQVAAPDRSDGDLQRRPNRALDPEPDAADTTAVSAPTTTGAAAPTSAAPRPTTTTRRTTTTAANPSGTSRSTGAEGTLASAPVSTRVVRCEDFTLQPEAQASFDADPTGRAGLDGDGDGIACEQLPGRSVNALPALTARRIPTTDELLRPSTRLYGLHTPQTPFATSEIESFSTAAQKAPNTLLFFQNFSQEFPLSAVSTSWSRGMLPMLSFEPIIQNSTVGQPTLAGIADGDWDEYFTRWATAAKEFGHPIALRFAQEMNGNWYSWSDGRFGNAPGDYVRAWTHLHDLMEGLGAHNLIWVWSVNRIDNLPDKTIARVYPGDDYVDWIGVSGYLRNVPDGVTPDFEFTFGQTLAALEAVAPDKLVMLTEVGAGTNEANRVSWLATFFQGLLDHPDILGFNWFNDFKDGGDWRIQYSTATSAAFAAGVADSRYGPIAPMLPE